jgi:putative membrane protein
VIGFLIRLAICAFGLWIASKLVPGFTIEGTSTLVLAAFLLGLVNAVVRPLVVLLTLPLTLVTLGLFLLVVNAAMLGLVAALLDRFTISGLLPALLGWLVVSLTNWLASGYIGPSGRVEVMVIRQ